MSRTRSRTVHAYSKDMFQVRYVYDYIYIRYIYIYLGPFGGGACSSLRWPEEVTKIHKVMRPWIVDDRLRRQACLHLECGTLSEFGMLRNGTWRTPCSTDEKNKMKIHGDPSKRTASSRVRSNMRNAFPWRSESNPGTIPAGTPASEWSMDGILDREHT